MYLCKRSENHNNIEVYSIDARKEYLTEYRRRLLEGKGIKDLFYSLKTRNSCFGEDFGSIEPLEFKTHFFNGNCISVGGSDSIQVDKDMEDEFYAVYKRLIQNYIEGNNNNNPNISHVYDQIYGLITTKGNPRSLWHDDTIYWYKDLIMLPPELCTLQLLLNERFHTIKKFGLDPSEQLDLFSTPHLVRSHSVQQLIDLHEEKLINTPFGDIEEKVATTEWILEKCKNK